MGPECPRRILTLATLMVFKQTLISMNFWYISQEPDFSHICDLYKDTVNNINFHYRINSEKVTKFFNKFKRCYLTHFPHFWGKNNILKKAGSVTHTWTLTPWKHPDPDPEKNWWGSLQETSKRKGIRPYFIGPYGCDQGSNKKIGQLTGIAVDNKNKIRYNLTDHTSLT